MLRSAGAGLAVAAIAAQAAAHPGGLNAAGCHNDRKHGGYHCHRGGVTASPQMTPSLLGSRQSGMFYANCAAARAAGAAPIRARMPGYGRHLDRDGDGIACE